MNSIHLELDNITFTYPGRTEPLFRNLNFSFREGKVGLIGDNGSGKTTLFHLIVGLLKPDRGTVRMNGRDIVDNKDFYTLRQHVGIVFQNVDDQLFSPTVLEDIVFGPLNMGFSLQEAKAMAEATLERIGMAGYRDRLTHQLSGGEKRLIALATVLVMQPEILLLDEPTNDLDPGSRNRLLTILGQLEQSFLLISHDWDFLGRLTDALYVLENGTLRLGNRVVLHQHQHAHPVGDQEHVHINKP